MDDLTENFFYNKRIVVDQSRSGYRFSFDAPVLADFLPYSPEKTALEIGTGSGIISLLSIFNDKFKKIYCYEIQERLSAIASQNVKKNGFEDRIEIINEDFLKNYKSSLKKNDGKFDIIFSNPPFYKINKGRISTNEEKALAKFEIKMNLGDLLNKTINILKSDGDLFLILPFNRLKELKTLSEKFGYCSVKKRDILTVRGGKPDRFLIQLRNCRDCPDLIDEDPLIIYEQKDIYTDEMNSIFGII